MFDDEPRIICRPDNARYSTGKCTAKVASDWTNPPAFNRQGERDVVHVVSRRARAVVLWENCSIDKFKNQNPSRAEGEWFAAVAPIFPLSVLQPPDVRPKVIALQHHSAFPLPAGGPIGEDSYVDLRYIAPVRQVRLKSNRVGSLSQDTLNALYGHMFAFFTLRKLHNVSACGNCGAPLDLALLGTRPPP